MLRPKLSDILEAELLKEIRDGRFGSNGRLPSENDLCRRFGVSRPIVRSALKRLRDNGLIHSRRGAGSFVKTSEPYPQNGEGSHLLRSIADVRKFYEYRFAVESEIAAAAANVGDDEAIENIGRRLQFIQGAIDSGLIGVDQDYQFHLSIAHATGNQFFENAMQLVEMHMGFVIDLARSFTISASREYVGMVQQEHAAIYQAIAKHDPDAARKAMQDHIAAARDRVFFGIFHKK